MVFEVVEDNLRTLALMNETGYSIQQDNGQRIYGPPPDWVGPAPKDTEIFIGKLPNDIYEYDIVPLFSSVGKIYLLRIMQNFSGLNRGFAFIQYTTQEEADKAIRLLNNIEIRPGEKIGVVKSRNNCRLYIGKLDTTMTKEEIQEELEKFTDDIVEVVIHKSEILGQNNRGYAFVEYLTHKAAAKARRKLVPCKIKIRGVEVTVDWATPLHECGEILNVFNSLLIKNIRETAKNEELCQFYSLRNKLKIIKFKRLPNKLVITFNSREEAERAMQIYEDLKNTKEFIYFAEKNKRVEIVWLKNNMNLSSFTSSINYTPPKFYDSIREECNNPAHQHNSSQIVDKSRQMNNRLLSQPPNNQPQSKSFVTLNRLNNNNFMNRIKAANERFIQDNRNLPNYRINKSNNFSNGRINGNNSNFPNFRFENNIINFSNNRLTGNNNYLLNNELDVNKSLKNRIPMSNHLNSIVGRNSNNVYECSSNTLAGRSSNQLGNTLENSLSSNRSNSITFYSPTLPVKSNIISTDSSGFNDICSTESNNLKDLANLNCGFSNVNPFKQQNNLNNLVVCKNLDYNPMLNSMNTSYNFGIWTNNYVNNLDVSANWSKFKDHKIINNPFVTDNSNDTKNNGKDEISSPKSNFECNNKEIISFNCFNPANSLNLHENFRDLNIEKNLSKYTFTRPVIQQ